MDQATFKNQGLLRYLGECYKNTDLDCNFYLCSGSYQKFTEDHGRKPVGECLKLSKCLWSATGVNPWVSTVKKELKLDQSLYTILQILSVTLFEKEPILQVLTNNDYTNLNLVPSNQLNLFD